MLIIRASDIPDKGLYYTMLCQELDKMGLESLIVDVAKGYLYEAFFCEE